MKEFGVDKAVESQILKRTEHIAHITETRKTCIILVSKFLAKQPSEEYKKTNSSVFLDIRPCSPFKINQRFAETHHFHLQG
jgi:aspartate oxidase